MIKKWHILLLICAGSSIFARSFKMSTFERAIAQADLARVQVLLKKIERKNLSFAEKKELYADLHDSAADEVDALNENMSFYRNIFDAGKTLIGGIMTVIGAGVVVVAPDFVESENRARRYQAAGGLAFIGGFLSLVDGLSCRSQRGWVYRVQELEVLFDARYEELVEKEVEKETE